MADHFQLQIEDLTHQAVGVGHLDGLAVFVAGALPGEQVRAVCRRRKKHYIEAELREILTAAPARVMPPCPLYGVCGGCNLQHASAAAQRAYKENLLAGTLRRIAKLEPPLLPMAEPGPAWHYRSRVQLHLAHSPSGPRLGFYQPGSHAVVAAESCRLLQPPLNELLRLLQQELPRQAAAFSGLRHLMLRVSSSGQQAALIFVGEAAEQPLQRLAVCLQQQFPLPLSCWLNQGPEVYGIYGAAWQLLQGAESLQEQIGDLNLQTAPAAFMQVNPQQMAVLYRRIAELAALSGRETVWDLYAGIGAIGLSLAAQARQVYLVESYAPALESARANAAANGLDQVVCHLGKAESVLPQLAAEGRADLALLDPPRAGLAAEAVQALLSAAPPRILYVSCDPATLARDLRLLVAGGYHCDTVQPFDLFPQTMHVEALALLERA